MDSVDVYLVTSNNEKYEMVRDLLDSEADIRRASVDTKEVQSLDPEEVVKSKIHNAYEEMEEPVISDDFAFFLEGLGSFPGPLIKYLLEETGLEGVKALDGISKGSCRMVCNAAYYDGDTLEMNEGRLEGRLEYEKEAPKADFLLNSVFVPDGYEKPLGELDIDNHRHMAYNGLFEAVDKL